MNNAIPALATFGAGCFWGVEAQFRAIPGVLDAAVGYTGGDLDDPSYRQVCSGKTGHAEVVQLQFDPRQVDYATLLEVFFDSHNPTTLNRQGPDVGSQYRSVIFYHDQGQRAQAEVAKRQVDRSGRWPRPVVTAIEVAQTFYRAEEYHQQYLAKNGLGHCRL